MNPDNPYAAPQTIEPRLGGSLPVAELAGRNLFPELSTVALRRLTSHSQAIDNMSLVWGTAAVFAGIVAANITLGALLFALLAGTRAWSGNRRTPEFERFNMILDVLVTIVMLGVILVGLVMPLFVKVNVSFYFVIGIPVLLTAVFSSLSAYAHYAAPVLYGNYPHRELVAETAYRKRHTIT